MNMDKAKLERYPRTAQNIKILEAEIRDMETTDAGMGSDTVLDYRSGVGVPTKVTGFEWPKYEQRQRELDQLRREEAEVREFVEGIHDPLTRQVFQLRVYNGLSWPRIARLIGEHNEGYPRKQIYEKYLKKSKSGGLSGLGGL